MKKDIINAYFELDAEEFAQYLTDNYLDKNAKNLTNEQLSVIEDYTSRLNNDVTGDFYDSEEQEQLLNVIFGYFGIVDSDWD